MRRSAGVLVIVGLAVSGAWATGPELPPGPAKAVIEAKCKTCHDLKKIVKHHEDAKWWANTLDKMVERGLEIEPDEQLQVLKYLTKNFGVASSSKKAGSK